MLDTLLNTYVPPGIHVQPKKSALLHCTTKKNHQVIDQIIQDFQNSTEEILLMSLDGFSGVGKSTMIQKIQTTAKKQSVPLLVIPNNLYLATESNTVERNDIMTSSWKKFQNNFYDFDKLRNLVSQIITANPSEKILAKDTYQRYKNHRPHGKLDGITTVTKPNTEKYIVLLDGINSTNYAQDINENMQEVLLQSLMIIDDPAQSILRAVLRNANQKKIDLRSILFRKLKEHFYMSIWMCDNLPKADHIFVNNPRIIPKQLQNYQKHQNLDHQMAIKQIISICENFLLEKVNDYPAAFQHFSTVLCQRIISYLQSPHDSFNSTPTITNKTQKLAAIHT